MTRKPIILFIIAVLTMGISACSNNTQNMNDGNAKRMANNRNNDGNGASFPQELTNRNADLNLFTVTSRRNNGGLISAYETTIPSDQYPQTKAILMEGAKYQFIPVDPDDLLNQALDRGGLNPQWQSPDQASPNPQWQSPDQAGPSLQWQSPDQAGPNPQEQPQNQAGPNPQGKAVPNPQDQLPDQWDQQQEPAAPAQPDQGQAKEGKNQTKTAPKQPAKNKTETTGTAAQFVQQVIDLTNDHRRSNGLPDLKANNALSDVAKEKAADMQRNNYFSHTSPTYGSPFDMMRDFGVAYKSAGENIAKGQRSPEEVVNAWMNSEGHRKNILSPNFTSIGVGFEDKENNWCQMFIGE